MGNPTTNNEVVIMIKGAAGQKVQLDLANSKGQVISQQTIGKAMATEQRTVKLGQTAGFYYLRVSTPNNKYTLKVLRN
jgi:hypothetical protein